MPLFLLPLLGWAKSAVDAILTFCSRPPGSYIAIAIGFILALWWFGQHEFTRGRLACEAAHVEAVRITTDRQNAAIHGAEGRSEARTNISTQHDIQIQRVIVHVKDMAAAMPDSNAECVPASVADGLRSLR